MDDQAIELLKSLGSTEPVTLPDVVERMLHVNRRVFGDDVHVVYIDPVPQQPQQTVTEIPTL